MSEQPNPSTPSLPSYIAVSEAARRIGVSIDSLKGWARSGEYGCPGLHALGPKVLVFREDELVAWIEARREVRGEN